MSVSLAIFNIQEATCADLIKLNGLYLNRQKNKQSERIWAWSNGQTISCKQASILYGRSVSTIYRWIKQGKLTATKTKGRWQIAI